MVLRRITIQFDRFYSILLIIGSILVTKIAIFIHFFTLQLHKMPIKYSYLLFYFLL